MVVYHKKLNPLEMRTKISQQILRGKERTLKIIIGEEEENALIVKSLIAIKQIIVKKNI